MHKDLYKYLIPILLDSMARFYKTGLIKQSSSQILTDRKATPSVKHLLMRIKEIPKSGYAFGHQDAREKYIQLLNDKLTLLAKMAKRKNKPFAMTEGGLNMVTEENRRTQVPHTNIAHKGISWTLFWRNAWPNQI